MKTIFKALIIFMFILPAFQAFSDDPVIPEAEAKLKEEADK